MKVASAATKRCRATAKRTAATPSRLLPISPSKLAARTIQKFWRYRFVNNTTAKIVRYALKEIHITVAHVKSISFESLVVFLRDKPVIAAMRRRCSGCTCCRPSATGPQASPSRRRT